MVDRYLRSGAGAQVTSSQDGRNDSRMEILRRVRDAIGTTEAAAPPIPRAYERSLPAGTDVIGLFAERVADYQASVLRVPLARLAGAIAESLRQSGARRVVVPEGLPAEWVADAEVEQIFDQPQLTHEDLDGVDAVVTGCAAAIAETGTIVLDAGPGQGRRALSLLPDHHLCVVIESQIFGTVPEALERLDPRRPQTWISGPSATSDIELQRVEGVHGPRNLSVLIVED
jgi:L-lactate dehydrogenase complex protein LldG